TGAAWANRTTSAAAKRIGRQKEGRVCSLHTRPFRYKGKARPLRLGAEAGLLEVGVEAEARDPVVAGVGHVDDALEVGDALGVAELERAAAHAAERDAHGPEARRARRRSHALDAVAVEHVEAV